MVRRTLPALDAARRTERRERDEDAREGRRVQEVDEREARGVRVGAARRRRRVRREREDEAREGGPADRRELEGREEDRERTWKIALGDEARDEGLPGRVVERSRRGRECGQRVDEADGVAAEHRHGAERQGDERHRGLCREHHAAAVVAVGDEAADERERHDRDDANEAHEAERERRAREHPHVPVDRDVLHLRSDEREELSDREAAEVAVLQRVVRARRRGHGRSLRAGIQIVFSQSETSATIRSHDGET